MGGYSKEVVLAVPEIAVSSTTGNWLDLLDQRQILIHECVTPKEAVDVDKPDADQLG
jgi:hypothetical protein